MVDPLIHLVVVVRWCVCVAQMSFLYSSSLVICVTMKPTTKKSIIKYILFVDVFKSIINKYL